MKKLGLYILLAVLVLTAIPAFAAGTNGLGDTIARNGELAAFLDGSGNIYISGLSQPVNGTKAESILSIDPYRILFFAKADPAKNIGEGTLIDLNLDTMGETKITGDAHAACLDGDNIYYVSESDRTRLMRYDLNTVKTDNVFTANEALERIYASQNGIITTLVEGAGAYITDAVTGAFVPYDDSIATEIASFEGFELQLSDNRNLYIQPDGAIAPTMVDSSVQKWAVIGKTVYYLSGTAENVTLKSYDTVNALWQVILVPSADMEVQLTASETKLFMLSKNHVVYTVNPESRSLSAFVTLPDPASYAMTGGKSIEGYRIEAVSGQLNIYGLVKDSNILPTFSFVDFSSQIVEDTSSEAMLLSAYAIEGESTVWNLLEPAQQYTTLRKGNRGEAVRAIQQPLFDLKYYDYYIDGIFGWRTELAVELLQADLGLEVTGAADSELQKLILSGKLAAYDPYKVLSRGDRGYRVQEMQLRLRDLGYLADAADSIFGPRTQSAVMLFQAENNLRETGAADSDTLRRLYSTSARTCSSYIDLEKGDSGYRVRELNARLKALYYLEGSVGSNYNSATAEAVTRFQQEAGLKQTGRATAAVQQQLFSRNAPEYSGYITLRRGDENSRVKEMQRRLDDLGYDTGKIDGYFGKQTQAAIRSFQRSAGLKDTGIADPETLAALFAADAPEYREPVKIGVPMIELSAWSKLENGIYHISDSDTTEGGVTVSWFAEGDVSGYDISIVDDRGNIYSDSKNVNMTIASIPVTSLDAERTYTITIVAHPADSKNDSDTNASIRFVRVIEAPEPEPEQIGTIGKLIVSPQGEDISREENVYIMPGDVLSFSWSADGSVAGYAYVIADSQGTGIETGEIGDTNGVNINASALNEGETYSLSVYAVPTNGGIEDATVESISFRKKPAEPDATEEPEAEIEIPSANAPEAGITPEPEVTAEPEITPEPEITQEPEPIVTIGTPAISIEPMIGSAYMEVPNPEGDVVGADVIHLAEGTISFSWAADGDVAGYNVRITDANGTDMVNQNLTSTGATIPSANLAYGMPYCLSVTAHAADGQTAGARAFFLLPAPAAPIVDEETDEPAAEEPVAEEPVIEEPIEEEPAEEPTIEEPETEPTPEPTEEPTPEPTAEPTPEPTEEPAPEPIEEPTPEPTEESTPEPTEEPVVEESYPADEPEAWTEAIFPDSSAEAIATIQQRLLDWGWLMEGDFDKGVLDEATLLAAVDFQLYCNENGMNVYVANPEDPVIDTDTLRLLFNADGVEIIKP